MFRHSPIIWMLIFACQFGTLTFADLRSTVSSWQESFKSSDFCNANSCQGQIDKAISKGQGQSSDNLKAAVEIINIYSSNVPTTFREVNAILRADPNSKVSETDKRMFIEYANILKMSIDLLCAEYPNVCGKHDHVYRSQSRCIEITGTTHTFDSFLSTSKAIGQAEFFFDPCGDSSLLFSLTAVEGIYISEFSDYPEEEEVLVKPMAKFQITQNLNSIRNATHGPEIEKMISFLQGTKIPKGFIAGTMIGFASASSTSSDPKYMWTVLTMSLMYMTFKV